MKSIKSAGAGRIIVERNPHRNSKIGGAFKPNVDSGVLHTSEKIPVAREGVSDRDRASPLTVSAFLSAGRAKMMSQEEEQDSCNEAKEEDCWVNISPYPSEGQIISPVAIF
jgi:hypothetical protein